MLLRWMELSSKRLHRKKEKISDRVTGGRERGGSQKSIDHGSTTEENESIEWVPSSPV
jgi:hypothetical protein